MIAKNSENTMKAFRIWCYRKYFLTTFNVWPFILKTPVLERPENACICVSVHTPFLSVPGGTLQCTGKNTLQMHPPGTCPFQVCVSTQLVCTKYVHIQRCPILFSYTFYKIQFYSFQLYWVIIDKIVMYLKCTVWWSNIGIHCEKIPTIESINISIISHS